MKMETQMNQKKYFVGIDIGTTKIVAVVGAENQFGKLEILGYGKAKSQGISRGMVDNILTTTKAIQQAVTQAQAKAGITITEAYVGIAGSHINSDEVSDYLTRKNPDHGEYGDAFFSHQGNEKYVPRTRNYSYYTSKV